MDSVLLVIPLLVIAPSSLMYPMPYVRTLASCSMGSHMFLFLPLTLCYPLSLLGILFLRILSGFSPSGVL